MPLGSARVARQRHLGFGATALVAVNRVSLRGTKIHGDGAGAIHGAHRSRVVHFISRREILQCVMLLVEHRGAIHWLTFMFCHRRSRKVQVGVNDQVSPGVVHPVLIGVVQGEVLHQFTGPESKILLIVLHVVFPRRETS